MKKSEILQGLTYITQLGLSVATPPVVCVLASIWAQRRWGLGEWIVPVGLLAGVVSGACSFVSFLRTMRAKADKKEERDESGQNR